jgi:glycosyltransferase involved in cell wall biosynthesis
LLHAHEIPLLVSAMAELTANVDAVVASHAYLAPFIARYWNGPLWYDAHNVEADMKADILGVDRISAPFAEGDRDAAAGERSASGAMAILAEVARAERALVRAASRVFAASEQNATRLAELYGRDPGTIERVPNGVSLPEDPWLEPDRRAALKASLGFGGRPVALFVGADHGPNHDAADILVDASRDLPDWSFWVVGSICNYGGLRDAPDNVLRLGLVSESELVAAFRATDVGLNPMLRGSGTNLKMLDYAAHGALVLSTEVGARGLGFVADTHYLAVAPDRFARTLEALTAELPSPRLSMRTAARRLVEQHFSWRTIADRIAAATRDG